MIPKGKSKLFWLERIAEAIKEELQEERNKLKDGRQTDSEVLSQPK